MLQELYIQEHRKFKLATFSINIIMYKHVKRTSLCFAFVLNFCSQAHTLTLISANNVIKVLYPAKTINLRQRQTIIPNKGHRQKWNGWKEKNRLKFNQKISICRSEGFHFRFCEQYWTVFEKPTAHTSTSFIEKFCYQKKNHTLVKTSSTPKPCIVHAKILKADYSKHNHSRAYDKITIDATAKTHTHKCILYYSVYLYTTIHLQLHTDIQKRHTATAAAAAATVTATFYERRKILTQ